MSQDFIKDTKVYVTTFKILITSFMGAYSLRNTFIINSAKNVDGIRCFVKRWNQIMILKDLICYIIVAIDWIENRLID